MPRTIEEPHAAPGSPSPSTNNNNNSSGNSGSGISSSSTHNGSTTRGPLSLPLLEGLRCRPGASDLCFHQGMKNFSSAQAIARFVQSKYGKKTSDSSIG